MKHHAVRSLIAVLALFAASGGVCHVLASGSPPAGSIVWALQDDGQDAGLPVEARPPAQSPAPESNPDPAFEEQDSMLDSHMSPDDDGDGVQDADDSHPNDPALGEKPAPGPTDPIADNDSDGLPNVMDPDDSGNGIPDAEDGVGEVEPVPTSPPAPPDNTGNAPQEPAIESPDVADHTSPAPAHVPATDSENGSSLVRALPSTGTGGTGSGNAGGLAPVFLIGSVLLFTTGLWSRENSRS